MAWRGGNIQEEHTVKYLLKYWIEWGCSDGGCVWAANEKAKAFFDTEDSYLSNSELPISLELQDELTALTIEYQSSLDWDYPPDPSPWTKEQAVSFKQRADAAYLRLLTELGDEFEVEYSLNVPYANDGFSDPLDRTPQSQSCQSYHKECPFI